jgi:LysM repeat protein
MSDTVATLLLRERDAIIGRPAAQTYVRFYLDIEHLFGQSHRMSRAGIRRRRYAVMIVATTVALGIPAVSRAVTSGGGGEATTRYVVRPGDTLWAIAIRQAPGDDPRQVVAAIVRANGVDPGTLIPGQVLDLPAPA